jgi:hypothetical protein
MVFLIFFASKVNIYHGFLHTVKIIHMGLEFYNAMVKRFYFIFLNEMQMQKVSILK